MKRLVTLLSVLGLGIGLLQGQNLILNGDFELQTGASGPDNWNNWISGGAVDYKNNANGNSSSFVNAWGGTWGNMAGWWQSVPVVAGVEYKLTVDSATENWWNPEGKIGLAFKDAGGNSLQAFELVVANYTANLPWTTYSLTALAPVNAAQVNVDLKFFGGGSVLFDNAALSVVPEPGTLSLLAVGIGLLFAQSRRNRRS